MQEIFEVTEDLMLNNLKIVQDKRYYRFTSDSILLSKFPVCKKGEKVADFCAGSGIVGLHFYGLNEQKVKSVTLFELQEEHCNLAEKSIQLNGLKNNFSLVKGKLQEAPKSMNSSFSLILCNPPYKKKDSGERNLSSHIAICRHECELTQKEICQTAKRLLVPGGRLCICQRIERLTELFSDLKECGLEPSKMAFVRTPKGNPYLVIVEATKDKKPQLKVLREIVNGEE